MITRPILAALAALALAGALLLWMARAPEVAAPHRETPHGTASVDHAPDPPAPVLAEPAADPQSLELPEPAAEPTAEAGFTIAVSAVHQLPNGARGPPAVASLELGVSDSRKELGAPLMSFATGPDGTAQIAFPRRLVPPPQEGRKQWLWLRSQGTGLLTRVVSQRVPEADGVTLAMSVTVQPGAVVEGRILGPDGQPAAGRVDWWFFGAEDITSSNAGFAGPDGLFRGELRHEGQHGLLAAGSSRTDGDRQWLIASEQLDLGTGFSELFEVDFDQPVPFIEVRVSGPGRLQGRVLDESGAPATGVDLVAVRAELDDGAGNPGPWPRVRELERLGGGHLRLRATTGADGDFALQGLRTGLFHVRAADGDDSSSGYPVLLTRSAVPADGAPLELRLTRPHLAIHVRQADGSLPEAAIGIHRDPRWGFARDPWPSEPELLVTLATRFAHLGGWYGAHLQAKVIGPGEFVAELGAELRDVPELELDVGLLGGELPWRPQRVRVPDGAGRVDVDVVLPVAVPGGALVLDVVDGRGAALMEGLRLRIEDPATGVVLVDLSCDHADDHDWPLRIPLPAGDFLLRVEGHARMDSHHGTLSRRRAHGAHEQPLRIAAGVETRVTARLGEPARLALRVTGPVTEADRAAVRARFEGRLEDDDVDTWARLVMLRLEREGRWPESPQFARFAMEGTSAAGTHLFPWVPLGGDETSEPLTPGTWTLVATLPGGRELRRPVTLAPGQTLSVTLEFE